TVFEASGERLALAADGPISIDVQYVLRPVPGGSDVRASVSVDGRGLFGRVLASATEALLAAGALRKALDPLGRQLRAAAGWCGAAVEADGDRVVGFEDHAAGLEEASL